MFHYLCVVKCTNILNLKEPNNLLTFHLLHNPVNTGLPHFQELRLSLFPAFIHSRST